MSHAGVLARLSAPLRDAGLLDEIAAFAHRHAAAAPRGS
jgi:hypothetical protein